MTALQQMPESECATEGIGEGCREAFWGVHRVQEGWGIESLQSSLPEMRVFECQLGVDGMTSCERGYQVEKRGV